MDPLHVFMVGEDAHAADCYKTAIELMSAKAGEGRMIVRTFIDPVCALTFLPQKSVVLIWNYSHATESAMKVLDHFIRHDFGPILSLCGIPQGQSIWQAVDAGVVTLISNDAIDEDPQILYYSIIDAVYYHKKRSSEIASERALSAGH